MTDPKRWLDDPDLDEEMRDLLNEAAVPKGMSDDSKKHFAVLAAQIAAGGVAAGTAGTASALGVMKIAKIAGALLLVGGVTVGGVVGVQRISESSSTPVSAPKEKNASTQTPRAEADNKPIEEPGLEPADLEKVIPVGKAVPTDLDMNPIPKKHHRTKHGLSRPKTKSIIANFGGDDPVVVTTVPEATLLEQARSSLQSRPGHALEITGKHKREYPRSRLSAEREFIAIQALLGLGRNAEALRRGESWLKRNPKGLYSRRIKKMLDGLNK